MAPRRPHPEGCGSHSAAYPSARVTLNHTGTQKSPNPLFPPFLPLSLSKRLIDPSGFAQGLELLETACRNGTAIHHNNPVAAPPRQALFAAIPIFRDFVLDIQIRFGMGLPMNHDTASSFIPASSPQTFKIGLIHLDSLLPSPHLRPSAKSPVLIQNNRNRPLSHIYLPK